MINTLFSNRDELILLCSDQGQVFIFVQYQFSESKLISDHQEPVKCI